MRNYNEISCNFNSKRQKIFAQLLHDFRADMREVSLLYGTSLEQIYAWSILVRYQFRADMCEVSLLYGTSLEQIYVKYPCCTVLV